MRHVRSWVAMLFALLFAAACVDSPTAPTAGVRGGPTQDIVLDPIVVIGDPNECDPYMDLNWCEGDGGDCMMSAPGVDPEEYVTTMGCGAGGGGGPGGGTTQPTDPNEPDCNPQYDPDCHQPLTKADSSTLRNALTRHINTQFTDPAKTAQCKQMKDEYDRLFATGNVYRGQFDTPQNDPHTPVHVGAYDPVSGTMHFEPSALDAANAGDPDAIRNIVNTALHEAAHALGYAHTDPIWMGSYDLYAEAPFNLLSPGTNSCLTNW